MAGRAGRASRASRTSSSAADGARGEVDGESWRRRAWLCGGGRARRRAGQEAPENAGRPSRPERQRASCFAPRARCGVAAMASRGQQAVPGGGARVCVQPGQHVQHHGVVPAQRDLVLRAARAQGARRAQGRGRHQGRRDGLLLRRALGLQPRVRERDHRARGLAPVAARGAEGHGDAQGEVERTGADQQLPGRRAVPGREGAGDGRAARERAVQARVRARALGGLRPRLCGPRRHQRPEGEGRQGGRVPVDVRVVPQASARQAVGCVGRRRGLDLNFVLYLCAQ
ncbi:hypothetical protein PsYK624_074740 [Phanerochaete sordida]|uniref:Uncharacterized protein n=1 Tax=Phanerochaete sordida TaxID=48140 RepID=A0A9P3GB16_9APHY|nr:hypothetical protein PsYK624_074740 [Phanerochaete sordida]